MLKKIGVVVAAAMVGVVALTVPASSQPEPRFTLQIDPDEGPVGTVIQAQLPEEATAQGGECLSKSDIQAAFQVLIASIIQGSDLQDPLQKALLAVIGGGIQQLDLNDPNTFRFFFVLVFADPATQRPAIDETTGEESETSFWDPETGQGSITAPPAARPKLYFVAAVCLDLKSLDEIDFAALAAALQAGLDEGGQSFENCLTQFQPGQPPPACAGEEGFQAIVESAATPVITELVDQNAEVAWVAPFCLLGDNGENCAAPAAAAEAPPPPPEGPGPPQPVAGRPRVTG
jgi:hypothetical protein